MSTERQMRLETDQIRKARVENEEQLLARLPEIRSLRGNVYDQTVSVFVNDVPEYFWLARASEDHHPPDERGLGGTWLHTKRVFAIYTQLERSLRAMSAISPFEANCARAATLLHDGFKYGRNNIDADVDHHSYADGLLAHIPEHTDSDHDILMANHVQTNTSMPEEVAHCIERHGGSESWYGHNGPAPDDDKSLAVHQSDLLASNSSDRNSVYAVSGELLQLIGQDIPVIESDGDWLDTLYDF